MVLTLSVTDDVLKNFRENFSQMSLSKQGVPLGTELRNHIVDCWHNGENITEMAKRLDIPYQTIWNVVQKYEIAGTSKADKGGYHERTSRTDDVIQ